MSTIKSSNEHLTFNADGSGKEVRFQANGTQKASISSAGAFTSTTIDATVLTGDVPSASFPDTLPAKSGANLTALNATNLGSGTVPTARLGSGTASNTTFLRGDGSWQVVAIPSLDAPTITGTLAVGPGENVTHTISNWSDDISYTITPTNCTVGSVNSSGQFVITHTSGTPSYTIVATTASLGLDDSATVTKNISMNLSPPTLSSPADALINTNVVYTITSTDSNDNKLILDPGTSNFTYQSVSIGSASKVGNTVECTGFGTGNPAVTIQFTSAATYSVTAKAVDTTSSYGDSVSSSADSFTVTAFSASGGTTSTYGIYKVHIFTGDGTFTTTGSTKNMDILLVGGGGGGGAGTGGGGGGGGVLYKTGHSVAIGAYTIDVGAGGATPDTADSAGYKGANTTGFGVTATGGGAGCGENTCNSREDGASGGGSNHASTAGEGTAPSASGWTGYGGYDGGVWGNLWVTPGGGAGAGANGGSGGSTSGSAPDTHGGNGVQIGTITDGSNNYYWGGGGGGAMTNWSSHSGTGGSGGRGGGGPGGNSASINVAGDTYGINNSGASTGNGIGGAGGANTGGGAGGSSDNSGASGAAGGSGIVVIRNVV